MENLENFFKQFEDWVLKDIRILLKLEAENGNRLSPDRKTYDLHRPFVAAVILICCAIDCMSAFRYGRKNDNAGKTFKDFINGYFNSMITNSKKSYNQKNIYEGIRSALVHGYSLSHDLALSHSDSSRHLEIENTRIIIDVYLFYYDLESAYLKYKEELTNGLYYDEFQKRWQFAPLIQYVEEENLKI